MYRLKVFFAVSKGCLYAGSLGLSINDMQIYWVFQKFCYLNIIIFSYNYQLKYMFP